MLIFAKTHKYLIVLVKINRYLIILIKINRNKKQSSKLLETLIIALYFLLIILFCLKIISFMELCTIILSIIATLRK
ncbi:hypothetical protein [Clostridium botulinum]|uniref:Uncharacterized protein n=1 Tax=Clostridium botulinum (strain Langeland / NCTC 10281 / Type F) TaxID=441772 RepID=A7GD07_CLOBL|nr:hypothetical protein [Clostridium botulinum]ABS42488.1 hypothetical protein CLI_1402 [Clostridium botulinum F str. Langeland]ADF99120.1 hypothetical protein CBF_1377 [Clostridium botulinum F str. 230613]KKM43322.1 hypothetical protein VT72_06670 [Clostridium botulinum]MBY6791161.1 hypothetical protein [Clostridium botulinum]MBY6936392.1 hypothetical protein [Clostridium botulinum]